MPDPGYAAFKAICPRVFRIETQWSRNRAVGTSFCIGRLKESNRLVLATAAHMIEFPPNETVQWLVQQFDERGNLERQMRFTRGESEGESICSRYKLADIGFLALPAEDERGTPFALPGEVPLMSIHERQHVCEGGRVGWAGFAGQVEDYLGRPQLCYFEGVVSAFSEARDKLVYVVDGHAAPGVSGGPVWHWPDGGDRIETVGVVSAYGLSEGALPGFCVFTPINPLMAFLKATYRTEQIET